MENAVFDRAAARYSLAAIVFTILFCLATGSPLAQTVTLQGNRPREADALTAPAASNRPLKVHIAFRLRNRAVLSKLLADLQDPGSAHYHQWLTPKQFNSRFGRTPAEVKAVTKWLSGQGLRV